MARSAGRRKAKWTLMQPVQAGSAALLGLVGRNPTLVGSTTAFLVTLGYVSANALWYQPHAHKNAFFATRAAPVFPAKAAARDSGTLITIDRDTDTAPARTGDPVVQQVQRILKGIGAYEGEVDGLSGPGTRKAIAAYQAKMGLVVTGEADDDLLDQLGAVTTSAVPTQSPGAAKASAATGSVRPPEDRVAKIQAGLKAFGHDEVSVDGVLGARTRAAIREFQSLFGLAQTGEPDDAVYAKMRAAGYIR